MNQHLTTIDIRSRRPHQTSQADELLREHATAYTRLVQAILATAPNGDFGGAGANHEITDPATDKLIGGGCLPEYVTRTLTRVFNEAADRLSGDDDLTALMDAVAEPAAARRMQLVAGGAR
ncbi:hypothetical protein [Streptomyces sioyaensis]|uniref:hypothetical protein n=1 Tax=Streptomyces sioyaensis TaxID=67364 RepID=UPI0037ACBCFF